MSLSSVHHTGRRPFVHNDSGAIEKPSLFRFAMPVGGATWAGVAYCGEERSKSAATPLQVSSHTAHNVAVAAS